MDAVHHFPREWKTVAVPRAFLLQVDCRAERFGEISIAGSRHFGAGFPHDRGVGSVEVINGWFGSWLHHDYHAKEPNILVTLTDGVLQLSLVLWAHELHGVGSNRNPKVRFERRVPTRDSARNVNGSPFALDCFPDGSEVAGRCAHAVTPTGARCNASLVVPWRSLSLTSRSPRA